MCAAPAMMDCGGHLRYAPGRTLQTEADNGLWAYTIDEHRTIIEIMDPYGGKRQRIPAPDGASVGRDRFGRPRDAQPV